MVAELDVRLLGRFVVRRGGREIVPSAFGGRLARTLVRVLLTRRGQFLHKDQLADALWPRALPANPAANLEILVSRARKALGDPSLIQTGPGGYAFTEDDRVAVDAEIFLSLARGGRDHLTAGRAGPALRDFRRALDAWSGEPLPEDAFAEWAQEFRRELARAHLESLEGAAVAALAVGDPRHAVAFAEGAAAREPLRESAHHLLVHALAVSGDQAGALAAFDSFRKVLTEDLGLDPSPEATDLQRRILRGEPLPPPVTGSAEVGVAPEEELLPFVGREEEVDRVLRSVSWGEVALVSGAAGTGKSRLLEELAARLAVRVLAVQAFMPERDEPWALARGLLRAALDLDAGAAEGVPSRAIRVLVDLVPELEELREVSEVIVDPESRRALVLEGGLRLVTAALPEGGVLLVDDLQWADATSLALLGRLIHRAERIGAAIAFRPEEVAPGSPVASFVAELAAGGRAADVRLGSLPGEAVAEIVGDPNLVQAIVELTDATPQAISEVVRALARERVIERDRRGRWHSRSPVSLDVAQRAAVSAQRRAIVLRAERLPAHSRRILDLLALVGREVPARVLARAAGQAERPVLEVLDGLARAGLARLGDQGWAPAHDLIGETLAANLSRERAATLHAGAAGALRAEGADPGEVARHLAGAGDAREAVACFTDAARRALDRFANQEASRLAEEGLALAPDPAVRSALLDVRAEARTRIGDLAGAREDLRAVVGHAPPGASRARMLARLAFLASGAEDLAQAGHLADLAITEAGEDARARAEALTVASIVDMNLGASRRAHERSEEALRLFEGIGEARGVAGILDVRAMATFLDGRIREAVGLFDRVARLFLDAGDLLRVYTPRSTRGHGLVFMARPADGLVDIEEALELVRSLGHLEGEAYCLWQRSEALATLGRAGEAVADAGRALSLAKRLGHREWTAACLLGLGLGLRASGDVEGAEAAFRRSLDVAETIPNLASQAAGRLALVLVAQRHLDEADHYVSRAIREGTGLSQFEARWARAELAAARGDSDARRVVEEALRLAESGGHLISALRLRELANLA